MRVTSIVYSVTLKINVVEVTDSLVVIAGVSVT